MTAIPDAADFTGAAVTEGGFKTAITNLRSYLTGMFGTDGTTATALSTLGAQADLDVVSQGDAEAGTAEDERVWTAQRVAQAIAAQAIAQGVHTQWLPASSWRPTESNGAEALAGSETTAGRPDIVGYAFDASTDEHIQLKIVFPKSWNGGTITMKPFWESAAADTDGVAWAFQGVTIGDGDTMDVAYGTAVVVTDDAQSTAEDLYIGGWSAAITIDNATAEELTVIRCFRDVSDANDDMAEDAVFIGALLRYTVNAADDS